ncbi:hypothetical protein GWI33_015139 [Rhynchophorus ferrugineus]|uniref:Uncharacterized protein n=1 Tax=Rhynchophorus ferrugineus TaxID=354439 RepID=A0A834M695_RHYFE|nr:hypothetical protein GWI33_015139 [Rhynchophorus ferrugineus]
MNDNKCLFNGGSGRRVFWSRTTGLMMGRRIETRALSGLLRPPRTASTEFKVVERPATDVFSPSSADRCSRSPSITNRRRSGGPGSAVQMLIKHPGRDSLRENQKDVWTG